MMESDMEHRRLDRNIGMIMRHNAAQIRIIRQGYIKGHIAAGVYKASSKHLLEEIRYLRRFPPELTYLDLVDEHRRRGDERVKVVRELREGQNG